MTITQYIPIYVIALILLLISLLQPIIDMPLNNNNIAFQCRLYIISSHDCLINDNKWNKCLNNYSSCARCMHIKSRGCYKMRISFSSRVSSFVSSISTPFMISSLLGPVLRTCSTSDNLIMFVVCMSICMTLITFSLILNAIPVCMIQGLGIYPTHIINCIQHNDTKFRSLGIQYK